MTRWKAFAIHFTISLVVIGSITAFIVWRWYPPQLFGMAKAGPLLGLLAGVDVVLGPLLTLLVYKQGKKWLKLDLTVIALLQVAALAWGLQTVWHSRPLYIVATSDRFRMVFANELYAPSVARAPDDYREAPAWGAKLVAAPLPEDRKDRLEVMMVSLSGLDISQRPEFFAPYPPRDPGFLAHAVPASEVLALASPEDQADWQAALARHADISSLAMLPLHSSRGSASVLLRADDGQVLGYSRLYPWLIVNAYEKQRHPQP
jgi:hypothetical protein